MSPAHSLTAILPCNDLDASEAFYARLGFTHREGDDDYRMLSDGRGGELHLTAAVEGWLVPGRNPFGLYLYLEEVDELAARMGSRAEDKPWGMYEFAVSDPDETLVRVGWPSRLRTRA
jgi:catechol 2,3-dioxygenase-like lactoylglutathione lyase family enzyme